MVSTRCILASTIFSILVTAAPTHEKSTLCRSGNHIEVNGEIICVPPGINAARRDLDDQFSCNPKILPPWDSGSLNPDGSFRCPKDWYPMDPEAHPGWCCCQIRCAGWFTAGNPPSHLKETSPPPLVQRSHEYLDAIAVCPPGWKLEQRGHRNWCCGDDGCFLTGTDSDNDQSISALTQSPSSSSVPDTRRDVAPDRLEDASPSSAVQKAQVDLHPSTHPFTGCPPGWKWDQRGYSNWCCHDGRCFYMSTDPGLRKNASPPTQVSSSSGGSDTRRDVASSHLEDVSPSSAEQETGVDLDTSIDCGPGWTLDRRPGRIWCCRNKRCVYMGIDPDHNKTISAPKQVPSSDSVPATRRDLAIPRPEPIKCPPNWVIGWTSFEKQVCCPGRTRIESMMSPTHKYSCCVGSTYDNGRGQGPTDCPGGIVNTDDPDYDQQVKERATKLGGVWVKPADPVPNARRDLARPLPDPKTEVKCPPMWNWSYTPYPKKSCCPGLDRFESWADPQRRRVCCVGTTIGSSSGTGNCPGGWVYTDDPDFVQKVEEMAAKLGGEWARPADFPPPVQVKSQPRDLVLATDQDSGCPLNWQASHLDYRMCCPGAFRLIDPHPETVQVFCCVGNGTRNLEGRDGCYQTVSVFDPEFQDKVDDAAEELGGHWTEDPDFASLAIVYFMDPNYHDHVAEAAKRIEATATEEICNGPACAETTTSEHLSFEQNKEVNVAVIDDSGWETGNWILHSLVLLQTGT